MANVNVHKQVEKKFKVKFNVATSVLLNPDNARIYDDPKKILENKIFDRSTYMPVQKDEIVELTEEQFNQFKGRKVRLSSGKGGNLSQLKRQLKENHIDINVDASIVLNYVVPICELVA